MTRRAQLSLFVPPDAARDIERVRQMVDPVQFRMIPAHVTLCREDELALLSPGELEARLGALSGPPVSLRFGRAERHQGHGMLLPCIGGEPAFASLRQYVLGRADVRRLAPHITLAHPRNSRAPGNELAHAAYLPESVVVTFRTVQQIEQVDGGSWRVLRAFPFPNA